MIFTFLFAVALDLKFALTVARVQDRIGPQISSKLKALDRLMDRQMVGVLHLMWPPRESCRRMHCLWAGDRFVEGE